MLPYIGMVPTYPLFFVLGFLVGASIAMRLAVRSGFPRQTFRGGIILAALAMLAGGKLHSLAERGQLFWPAWWELFAGYHYPGGLLLLLITLVLAAHWHRWRFTAVSDCFVPALAFAAGTIRIGCFLAGCCFGNPSTLPWAVSFPASSRAWTAYAQENLVHGDWTDPLHPLQLYFALMCVTVGIITLRTFKNKAWDGQVLCVYLIAHGFGKFALEFMRHEQDVSLRVSSLAFGLTGLVLFAVLQRWSVAEGQLPASSN